VYLKFKKSYNSFNVVHSHNCKIIDAQQTKMVNNWKKQKLQFLIGDCTLRVVIPGYVEMETAL